MATYTITGTIKDIVGTVVSSPRGAPAKAFLIPYSDMIQDGTNVRVGTKELTLDGTGAFSQASVQGDVAYAVEVRYWDPASAQTRSKSTPFFVLTANTNIKDIVTNDPYDPATSLRSSFPAAKPGSGDAIGSWTGSGSTTDALNALGDMCACPIYAKGSWTVAQIAIQVATATATAVHRLGLYRSTPDGRIGTLLVDGGTVDSSTTGIKTVSVSVPVNEELVWGVAVPQVALARYKGFTDMIGYPIVAGSASSWLTNNVPGQMYWRTQGVTGGALPNSPVWNFRIASPNAVPQVVLVAA